MFVKESDGKGGVLIVGNGYVWNDWGVFLLLEEDKLGKSVFVIGILEVIEEVEMLNVYVVFY